MAPSSLRKVIVGATPENQRTWHLPITLLIQYSTHIRTAYTQQWFNCIELPNTAPSTFKNFLDFMYSNIYSLNRQAPDYHPVLSNVEAWILGDRIKAVPFQIAAMRSLHDVLAPLANSYSTMAWSPVRASDVEYVCVHTPASNSVRAMIFDAVAAHWHHKEIEYFCRESDPDNFNHLNRSISSAYKKWLEVSNKYNDFGARVRSSVKVNKASQHTLLRPIDDYLNGNVGWKENEVLREGRGHRSFMRTSLMLPRAASFFTGRRRNAETESTREIPRRPRNTGADLSDIEEET
jgi:hypothetical protein